MSKVDASLYKSVSLTMLAAALITCSLTCLADQAYKSNSRPNFMIWAMTHQKA